MRWIRQECRDYENYLGTGSDGDVAGPGRWSAPPPGKFKLNTDGSFSSTLDRTGMGGLIRDASGNWVVGFFA